MEVTQDIKLNINDTGQYTVVTVKQIDSGRVLNVTMVDDDAEIEIPSTATASIRVLKEDGTSVDDACTISDGKIVVELTDQITAVAGYAKADISVASGGKIVSTATFLIKVGAVPMGVEIVSENEFTQLSALIASASQYETRIGNLEEMPKTYYGTVSEIDESGTMEVEGNSVDLMAYYGLEEGTTLYVMFGCDWMETEHEQYFSIIGIESIAINNKSSVDEWIPDYAWFSTGDIKQFVYDDANWVLQDAVLSEAINDNAEAITASASAIARHNTRIGALEEAVSSHTTDIDDLGFSVEVLQAETAQNQIYYGECYTVASDADKDIDVNGTFTHANGRLLMVYFDSGNTSTSILALVVNGDDETDARATIGYVPEGGTVLLRCTLENGIYTYNLVSGDYNTIPSASNKALVTDSEGHFTASSVTATELSRLSGVTGNVQEQINTKQPKIAFGYCNSDKDESEKVVELEDGYTFGWEDGEFLMVEFNYGNSVNLININIAGELHPSIPCGDLSQGKSALFRVYHKGLAFGISTVCGGNNVWSNGNTIIVN